MVTANLIPDLKRDEGLRLSAYPDPLSHGEPYTVGYGHTGGVHPGTVWTQAQADAQLSADVAHTEASLDIHLPWWRTLDGVRQDVICEMAFNMGVASLCQFHNTLGAIQRQDWPAAKAGMLASLWATQVGNRAKRLAEQMLTGEHEE